MEQCLWIGELYYIYIMKRHVAYNLFWLIGDNNKYTTKNHLEVLSLKL
jgi:uncharacterized protein YbcV (DUF1398 family)